MLGSAPARLLPLAVAVALLGCPPPPRWAPEPDVAEASTEPPPRPPPPRGLRAVVADLEAHRAAGIAGLIELTRGPDPRARRLALRGLGRVGDREAIAALLPILEDPDPEVASAAAHAIGLTDAPGVDAPLIALLGREDPRPRIAALDALGRVGAASSMPAIAAALGDPDDAIASAAGLALARMGRRGLELDAGARAALIAATEAPTKARRYAAVVALARAPVASSTGARTSPSSRRAPPNTNAPAAVDDAAAALRARLRDEDPAIRAEAAIGCGRRGLRGDPALIATLGDPTWTVRLEAARALSVADAPPAARQAVAVALRVDARELLRSDLSSETWPILHVLEDSLRLLRASAAEPSIRALAGELQAASAEALAQRRPPLAASRLHCAAAALAARAERDLAALAGCGGPRDAGMAPHLRDALLLEALGEGLGGGVEALAPSLAAADPRVRSVAVAAAVQLAATELAATPPASTRTRAPRAPGPLAGSGDAAAPSTPALAAAIGALDDPSPAVVGAAADGLKELAGDASRRPRLAAAIAPTIARARAAHAAGDLELTLSLLALLRALAAADALPLCRDLVGAAHPGLRSAALGCVDDLHARPPEEDPEAPPIAPPAPPYDPAEVLGQRLTWQITTTRGTILIALDPEVAPLSVAAIAGLSDRGFYGGLAFHRVVADFVIQGGDPEGTGWGGPGFSLPTEASWAPFERGAVGLADAGKDSGGSQWFIMQSRAPHLEGRYTWVGEVIDGMAIVDGITTDDRILDARVLRAGE